MEAYEPSSPTYSGPQSLEGGSTKQLTNRKRRRAVKSSSDMGQSLQPQGTAASDRPLVKELQVGSGSVEEGFRSPNASARTADRMNEVESSAAGGAQSSAGLVKIRVAGGSAEEGVCSPRASAPMEDRGHAGESGGASDAESSAETSCDSGPVPIGVAASRFRKLGYPVFSIDITWDPKTAEKKVNFPHAWTETTLTSGTVRDSHNSLAINTNKCDLLAVDVDVQDSGLAAWETLQQAHGVVEAPLVWTASGGLHVYFSRSKSVEAGLSPKVTTNSAKLFLNAGDSTVEKVGIDLSGKGGCLIAPGSSYTVENGPRRGYCMAEGSRLPPITDLPPLPSWLIDILDRQASLRAIWNKQGRERKRREKERKDEEGGREGGIGAEAGARESSEPALAFGEPDLVDAELQTEVVGELEKLLSTWGDNTSVFNSAKPSSTGTGVIYEFRNAPGGRVTCPYFPETRTGLHDSNNFGLLRRGAEISYICHGESCKTTSRSGNIRLGVLPLPIAAAFGDSQPLNSERDHLYSDRQLLALPFLRDNLSVKKGDVGGAIILERLYVRTGLKFAFTSSGSHYWTGRCWAKDESGGRILRVLREELSKIEAAYMRDAGQGAGGGGSMDVADGPGSGDDEDGEAERGARPSRDGKGSKKDKKEKLINVNFNSKMSNILSTCKDYFYQADFQSLLDVQKDFRAAANGVIDLRTGELLPHHPRFMNSRVIDWPYPRTGLSCPRGAMVSFLEDIMHISGEDGPAALEHLQVLLGYGLTGHTSNQVLGIFVGEGSAGKSLLLALLRKLLGPAYKDVRKEIVVNAKGQRAAAKGAASPLEAGLAGALLAVVEETDKTDTLDEAGMKKLTGSDVITARPLFREYITFTTTVLLLLCTNYLPRTDKTWSVALRRRLQLVCFVRRYFSPHEKGYDPADPLHGVVNTQLLAKLSTLHNMQELLAWLVAGAVKWYQNGQQLNPMPERSLEALREYEESNDDFEQFVISSCVVGKDLFISTQAALNAYNDPQRMVDGEYVNDVVQLDNKTLKAVMNAHGFAGPDKPSKLGLGVKYSGVTERGYKGLALRTPCDVKVE